MPDVPEGCATPSPGPLITETEQPSSQAIPIKEVTMERARVGKPAPDFELTAFFGDGFQNIRLSDYKGKWSGVCVYPGDFTFV